MQAARRAFLRARIAVTTPVIRPPWAVPEPLFVTRCLRCEDCVSVCPSGILRRGEGGFPVVDFLASTVQEGCSFCGACVEACHSASGHQALSALEGPLSAPPWGLRAEIMGGCLAKRQVVCRSCGDSCPVGAIRFLPRVGGVAEPLLESDLCTGCGNCLRDCPTLAIEMKPVARVQGKVA